MDDYEHYDLFHIFKMVMRMGIFVCLGENVVWSFGFLLINLLMEFVVFLVGSIFCIVYLDVRFG